MSGAQRHQTCQRPKSLRKTFAQHRRRLRHAWQRSVYPLFFGASESLSGPPDATYLLTRFGGSLWRSLKASNSVKDHPSGD